MLREDALRYHEDGRPGKLEVRVTKPMTTARDLSLAYSPGVADACTAIEEDAAAAARYTGKGNLVAVVSNGTAVLGLGNIGALASKPVMEGKAALFKKFANIDCYDIEVDETDPAKLAEIVIALEPTFGAINLEDIKAPECFEVERICKERMGIPVFHDDQHGTAIVCCAAAVNALKLGGKKFENIKLTVSGGGAAGTACINLLITMGVKRENILVCDRSGVIHAGRDDLTPDKQVHARETDARTLEDAIKGADMFLGVSAPGVLTQEMVKTMAPAPIIFGLANPVPEIMPDVARDAAPDALIATGRSDYPNQVNNVLCFPFIFRGALDVGATEINEEMKVACVHAIAALARAPSTAEAAAAYSGENLVFGPDYLIPKPFDPRLLSVVATAVAKTAMETGVAMRPLEDVEAYRKNLLSSVFRTGFAMKPIFERAMSVSRRIVFAEGEDERALRCAQNMLQDGIDAPILIGRPGVVQDRLDRMGVELKAGADFEIVNPEDDPRYFEYWSTYYDLKKRDGVSTDLAKAIIRTNTTAIAATMVHRGEADSMICGLFGEYGWHLKYIADVLARDGRHPIGALSLLIMDTGPLFIADTHVHEDPSAEQLVEIAVASAAIMRDFKQEPKAAFISNSNFGSVSQPDAAKMRRAVGLMDEAGVDFEYEGEMHADTAMDPKVRERIFPSSRLHGTANLLVMPNASAASVARNLLKTVGKGMGVGPILMGLEGKAHIVTPSATARGLINIAALAGG
ncbi:NADP-dependent malic enzyme [Pikeienuella piscinae]|uniref:NADP-dependent malic enzyme n=1 Tax=Pikeienuella piscinae TaxID=2748098 RepID=A0A7M3T6X2_9RHOB|nr:NADP-dependent malic enzyme [Pikeienuella piscinae]QIE57753.1 NADP-dependent malic enzyme [Pikeienuella piscinae]